MKLEDVKSFTSVRMPAGDKDRESKHDRINFLLSEGWEILKIVDDGDGWGYVYLGHYARNKI